MIDLFRQDSEVGLSMTPWAIECGQPEPRRRAIRPTKGRTFAGGLARGGELDCQATASSEAHGRAVLQAVSSGHSVSCSVTASGLFATPGGTAPFCFLDSSPRASLGPCSRMHGLALGSRAHSHGFAQV